MVTSPEQLPENRQDFQHRAPPPSPIATASGRRSAVTEGDMISEFLEQTLRIPDLVLPESIFPKEISVGNQLEIDFQLLISQERESVEKVLESAAGMGCFELVNCEVSRDLVRSVRSAGAGMFGIEAEKKAEVQRTGERRYGFEAEGEMSEEFFWCGGDEEREGLRKTMERIWPVGFSNFSEKMESLSKKLEKIAATVMQILLENMRPKSCNEMAWNEEEKGAPVLCLYKHGRNIPSGKWVGFLQSDIIRMLLRRSDYSHTLCLHLCDGATKFHVYSKKGWMSFCPNKDAIIVTVGDQLQEWSNGLYKHVIGRPILHMEDEDSSISMAFLYSPSPVSQWCSKTSPHNDEKYISLGQQMIIAICLTLLFQFIIYIYKKI